MTVKFNGEVLEVAAGVVDGLGITLRSSRLNPGSFLVASQADWDALTEAVAGDIEESADAQNKVVIVKRNGNVTEEVFTAESYNDFATGVTVYTEEMDLITGYGDIADGATILVVSKQTGNLIVKFNGESLDVDLTEEELAYAEIQVRSSRLNPGTFLVLNEGDWQELREYAYDAEETEGFDTAEKVVIVKRNGNTDEHVFTATTYNEYTSGVTVYTEDMDIINSFSDVTDGQTILVVSKQTGN